MAVAGRRNYVVRLGSGPGRRPAPAGSLKPLVGFGVEGRLCPAPNSSGVLTATASAHQRYSLPPQETQRGLPADPTPSPSLTSARCVGRRLNRLICPWRYRGTQPAGTGAAFAAPPAPQRRRS